MRELLRQFKSDIKKNKWGKLPELTFRIIYGSNAESQIDLARFMMARYLPIFIRHQSNRQWAQELIEHTDSWVQNQGRSVPIDESESTWEEATFHFCFDALLLAYSFKSNPLVLTSSSVVAVHNAIEARAKNVWEADDPEAVEISRNLYRENETIDETLYSSYCERSPDKNVACIAVKKREWTLLGDQLKAFERAKHLEKQQDLEKDLSIWLNNEQYLVCPDQ